MRKNTHIFGIWRERDGELLHRPIYGKSATICIMTKPKEEEEEQEKRRARNEYANLVKNKRNKCNANKSKLNSSKILANNARDKQEIKSS